MPQPLPPPLFLMDKTELDGISSKIKWKIYACLVHCISSFEDASFKKYMIDTATSSFVSCCFLSAFTSADIIFYNFLELHCAFSNKKIFVMNFPFSTDCSKNRIPPPLNCQNLLSAKNFFCRCSLSQKRKRMVTLYWKKKTSEFPLFILFFKLLLSAPWLSFGLFLRGQTQSPNVNHCCFNAI